MPVAAYRSPSFNNKHALAAVGQTLVDSRGDLADVGKAFVDADIAIAKLASVFSSLDVSAKGDLGRAFTDANIRASDSTYTAPTGDVNDTAGIINDIATGKLDEFSAGLSALSDIIKGRGGERGIPSLTELGDALTEAVSALAEVSTLVDNLSDSARTTLGRVFFEAGYAEIDNVVGDTEIDGLDTEGDGGDTRKADGGDTKGDGGDTKGDGTNTKADAGGAKATADSVQYSAKDTQDDDSAATLIGNYSDNGSGGSGVDYN